MIGRTSKAGRLLALWNATPADNAPLGTGRWLLRPLQFRPKLVASYVCALLVLSVGVVAVLQNREAAAAEARSNALRVTVRRLLQTQMSVLNAETGQRGYLLTGDPRYRVPYDSAVTKLGVQLAELRESLRNEPEQLHEAEQLRSLVQLKLDELAETIRLHDTGGDARALVKHNQGQRLMEQIRRKADALALHARQARDIQERHATSLLLFARWFVGVGNAFAFLLAIAVTFWIGRAFRDAELAGADVERHVQKLEDNAQRLAEQELLLATRLSEERRLSFRLERTNEALQKSNADLEYFAYMASHDLRAPLRGIANVSEWIEEDLGDDIPAETKRHMEALRGRVRRLEGLIAAIAAYTRAGQRLERPESVDLEELVQELVEALPRPADLEIHWHKPLPTLSTVRQPLHQILMNLLSNAIKHGASHGGRVELTLRDDGAFWRFDVSDNGPGIAPEYHAKIFGLFQTLASRDQVESTGIGLAIVKKLVDRYGGEVSVASHAGQGATFSVRWPKNISDSKHEGAHA